MKPTRLCPLDGPFPATIRPIQARSHAFAITDASGAQPRATCDGANVHPTWVEQMAARGYTRARHHPCVDENTRVAHAAMETCLLLNGMILHASVDEQEQLMLALAAGRLT